MPLRSFSQAEITLTERRRLERPLLVMIWLGIVGFSFAEGQGNSFYLLFGTVAIVVNVLASHRAKEVYLQRLFVNACVIVATFSLLVELFLSSTELLVALGHYLILIQLCKLFERKSNRDYVQMMVLSMLLIVASALTASTVWFAVVVVIYLVVACYTAMVFTLKRGLDAAAAAHLETESGPLALHRIAWNVIREWPTQAIRRQLLTAIIVIFVAGVGMFVIAPRNGDPSQRLISGEDGQIGSGYSGSVTLGQAKQIYLSDRVVMRASISSVADGGSPWKSTVHLRGKTFNCYSKSRWTNWRSFTPASQPKTPSQAITDDMLEGAVVQKVSMLQSMLPNIFAIYPAVHVTTQSGKVRSEADLSLTMTTRTAHDGVLRYTAYSWPRPLTDRQREYVASAGASGRGDANPPGKIEIAEPVAALARQWCRDLLDQLEENPDNRDKLHLAIARRIAKRLEDEYKYTLDLSDADESRDGVEDFLFRMKRGHCEYFASALVIMCRSLGVPARLATGFRIDSANRIGKQYVVRERDAHAWAEVYTRGTDWIVVDPSPRGSNSTAGVWLAVLKDYWQNLQFSWYEKFIGYDAAARKSAVEWVVNTATMCWSALTGAAETLRQSAVKFAVHGEIDGVMLVFAVVVGSFGILLTGTIFFRQWRRNVRALQTRQRKLGLAAEQAKFISHLYSLLERHGLMRRPEQTPLALVNEAALTLGLPGKTLTELIELYYRLRWGRLPTKPDEIAAAEAKVEKLTRALAHKV